MRSPPILVSSLGKAAILAAGLLMSSPAWADNQTPVDRSDPAVVAEEQPDIEPSPPPPRAQPVLTAEGRTDGLPLDEPLVAGAIRVEGATILPPATFAPSIEPYLGRPLTAADLRRLAGDVADAARGSGFGLATAWIPAQSVESGVLRVRVDEGRIDAVEAEGPAGPVVERVLTPLAGHEPVRTDRLERRLLLAEDLAGVSVRRARLVRLDGRNLLRVETGRERALGRVQIDNWGTDAAGPVRAHMGADFHGILGFADRLTINAMLTPLEPSEFQFLQAAYSAPIGSGTDATLRGYASRLNAGASLRERDFEGDGFEIEAGLSRSLVRSRAHSLWGHVFFGLRESRLDREQATIRDDRIVTLRGILYGTGRIANGRARVRLSLVQGLDILGATERGEPLASRADAGGAFTKVQLWAELSYPLGGRVTLVASGEGQIASRPLLASEEMGLGGRFFLRGYDYREFAGDRGAAASVELRYDLEDVGRPLSRAQIYAYADGGQVTNRADGTGGGSLASAGGGLRVSLDPRIDAGVELGIPLADGANGERPRPRLSFVLSHRF